MMTSDVESPDDTPSFKHRLRSGIDRAAELTGFMRLLERRMRRGLTILMYHRVLPLEDCRDYPLASLVIPQNSFDAQVEWLASHCEVLPVAEAMDELANGRSAHRPLLAISFDDGYWDNHALAAPILEKHGVRGTFYVTSDFVNSGQPLWFDRAAFVWDRLSREDRAELLASVRRETSATTADGPSPTGQTWTDSLKALPGARRMKFVERAEAAARGTFDAALCRPMTPEQVIELARGGHEIGSHSVTHPILPLLNDADLDHELRQSAAQLEAWTGKPVTGLCYPNGDSDARVEAAVRAAGYRYAGFRDGGMNLRTTNPVSLTRIAITMQRTVVRGDEHDAAGFRAEVCRFRELLRR